MIYIMIMIWTFIRMAKRGPSHLRFTIVDLLIAAWLPVLVGLILHWFYYDFPGWVADTFFANLPR